MGERGINKENEKKLREYLFNTSGKIVPSKPGKEKVLKGNKVGRPVERITRPDKSAAKRTNPGEERYIITIKTEKIALMKDIAEKKKILIKDAYDQALINYIEQFKTANQ